MKEQNLMVECDCEEVNSKLIRIATPQNAVVQMSVAQAKALVDDLQDVLVMAENELANRPPDLEDEYRIRYAVRYSFKDSRGNKISGLCKAFDNPGDAEEYRIEMIRRAANDSRYCHHTYYIEKTIINDD